MAQLMSKRSGRRPRRAGGHREPKEFEQKTIDIARVTRVVAGGKRMRFRATVAVGDLKGRVGVGIAKGADVSNAVQKAYTAAKKRVIRIPVANETIPHAVLAKYRAARILLKPAPVGTGVIAGGPVRAIMELAGIKNVVGKVLGSPNKINNLYAIMQAIRQLRTKEQVGQWRGKTL